MGFMKANKDARKLLLSEALGTDWMEFPQVIPKVPRIGFPLDPMVKWPSFFPRVWESWVAVLGSVMSIAGEGKMWDQG